LVDQAEALENLASSVHRADGVVLMRPETGHHPITQELRNVTAIAIDRILADAVIAPHKITVILRIQPLGQSCRSRDVAEEDRERPALVLE
jgi:hypothetical protein